MYEELHILHESLSVSDQELEGQWMLALSAESWKVEVYIYI